MNAQQNSTVYTTDTTAQYEQFEHSGREYSPQAETLLKNLIKGGKHATNAIKTIAGISKLDVEKAEKVYKALRVAGLTLPSIVLFMLNAPASVLLATLTGAGVGLLGNKGAKEAQKIKDQRTREQVALDLATQYNGRIAYLENHIQDSKMQIKSKFEALKFIYQQKMECLHDEIATQQALIVQQSTQLHQAERAKELLETDLKKQFGQEVDTIITEANKKIEKGNKETQKALSMRDDIASRLAYADNLCRDQAKKLQILENQQEDYYSVCEALEAKGNTTTEGTKEIHAMKQKIKKLKTEKKSLKNKVKQSHKEIMKTKNEVIASKDETIASQRQEIESLKFMMKYALIVGRPDTGTTQGAGDSKRYTAICEGVQAGYIQDLSFTALKGFKYAGKGASQSIVKKYREALIDDGLARMEDGELKPVIH